MHQPVKKDIQQIMSKLKNASTIMASIFTNNGLMNDDRWNRFAQNIFPLYGGKVIKRVTDELWKEIKVCITGYTGNIPPKEIAEKWIAVLDYKTTKKLAANKMRLIHAHAKHSELAEAMDALVGYCFYPRDNNDNPPSKCSESAVLSLVKMLALHTDKEFKKSVRIFAENLHEVIFPSNGKRKKIKNIAVWDEGVFKTFFSKTTGIEWKLMAKHIITGVKYAYYGIDAQNFGRNQIAQMLFSAMLTSSKEMRQKCLRVLHKQASSVKEYKLSLTEDVNRLFCLFFHYGDYFDISESDSDGDYFDISENDSRRTKAQELLIGSCIRLIQYENVDFEAVLLELLRRRIFSVKKRSLIGKVFEKVNWSMEFLPQTQQDAVKLFVALRMQIYYLCDFFNRKFNRPGDHSMQTFCGTNYADEENINFAALVNIFYGRELSFSDGDFKNSCKQLVKLEKNERIKASLGEIIYDERDDVKTLQNLLQAYGKKCMEFEKKLVGILLSNIAKFNASHLPLLENQQHLSELRGKESALGEQELRFLARLLLNMMLPTRKKVGEKVKGIGIDIIAKLLKLQFAKDSDIIFKILLSKIKVLHLVDKQGCALDIKSLQQNDFALLKDLYAFAFDGRITTDNPDSDAIKAMKKFVFLYCLRLCSEKFDWQELLSSIEFVPLAKEEIKQTSDNQKDFRGSVLFSKKKEQTSSMGDVISVLGIIENLQKWNSTVSSQEAPLKTWMSEQCEEWRKERRRSSKRRSRNRGSKGLLGGFFNSQSLSSISRDDEPGFAQQPFFQPCAQEVCKVKIQFKEFGVRVQSGNSINNVEHSIGNINFPDVSHNGKFENFFK